MDEPAGTKGPRRDCVERRQPKPCSWLILLIPRFPTEGSQNGPETTQNIEDGGRGGGPPEERVSEEIDVVVGFFATVVVQAATKEEPSPWVGGV